MKARLLCRDRNLDLGKGLSPRADILARDLGLDTLFDAMAAGDRLLREIARHTVLDTLVDASEVTYRQGILADCLANPGAVRQLHALLVEGIEEERHIWGWTLNRYPDAVLRRSVDALVLFTKVLRQLRDFAQDQAGRLTSEGFTRLLAMLQAQLTEDYLAELDSQALRLRLREGVHLSARLGEGNRASHYILPPPEPPRSVFERLRAWAGELTAGGRTRLVYEVPDRDEAGMQALGEIHHRGIAAVAATLGRSTDHIRGFLACLREELGFYIACLNLADRLAARGLPVVIPEVVIPEGGAAEGARAGSSSEVSPLATALQARGLYDGALALRSDSPITGNDLDADGRQLLLITGANRGGKTTFLRSLGQATVMMQCGMFVPAERFRASLRTGLFSHFKREEDAGLKRGKLDEELARMSTIVDEVRPGALVLMNESFASTSEREGSQIAAQVIRALTRSGVCVVMVSHLHELARSCLREREPSDLFLRAERLPDGRRTFRIREGEPLSTSYGPDLYRRIFGQESQTDAAPA